MGRNILVKHDLDAGLFVEPFSTRLVTESGYYLIVSTASERQKRPIVTLFRDWLIETVNRVTTGTSGDMKGDATKILRSSGAQPCGHGLFRHSSSEADSLSRCLYPMDAPSKVELGLLRGQIEARKEDGDYGIHFPARYNIRSLHVPPDAQGIVRLLASPTALLEPADDDDDWWIGTEWECDNGATFCLGFVLDPTPVPVSD